ncbi:hypothetical protein OW492_11780 [Psychromonas sp. 14N.309.X.WAT.B.A12]|uniref:hypothetical protein n=1 Tax=Psychromonas sp. 14N.309.X.WAT.B.A12 TaxID=2998322 RepID=UPI0025AFD467|nr:hypothetical protein [Psychromonas sp. 14N.309.X.WAT.B.A12]MDN2664055.1 hypothetical protein [Psychromonas sp. 14N.309.X.WAT.B.A12]
MSFLSSLFKKKPVAPTRILNEPKQLLQGDIFCFGDSFALPEAMRKQQLQVTDITTVEFQHEHYVQLTSQGASDKLVYLSFPKNPKNLIKCSLLLSRAEVETLFDLDAFSEIFEAPGKARLTPLTEQHNYGDMLASEYIQQDFETSGYIHQADYRDTQPPQFTDQNHGREFQYFSLEGNKELRGIDIFIFENGDTDVYLSSFRPANDIAELWIKGE